MPAAIGAVGVGDGTRCTTPLVRSGIHERAHAACEPPSGGSSVATFQAKAPRKPAWAASDGLPGARALLR